MPFDDEGVEEGIGLALSGGGFRATLFHIGALWRLTELGVLAKVSRISSVSGGAIAAGMVAAAWPTFRENPNSETFRRTIAEPLRAFCRRRVDTQAVGEGLLNPWKSISTSVEDAYTEHLFDVRLDQLPDTPRFVFNSTNLRTGRSFRFSKPYMGDYRIGLVRNPQVPLARAVAASSAFPPFLSPVTLDNPGMFEPVPGSDLAADPEYTKRLFLTDGGVYDNLGLETVWNRYKTVLVSDAGAPFDMGAAVETDWIKQTLRALDIATDQSRGLRKRALIDAYRGGERQGAYWGIDTDITDYATPGALACNSALVEPLATMRTRLNPFDDIEQERLINWGYALCDAAVRKRSPEILEPAHPPAAWPCRANPLG